LVRIGSLDVDTNIFLAPLAGCSDLSFRLVAREHGAKFCFFEMLDANSIVFNRKVKPDIVKTVPEDRPIAAQLLGSEPDQLLEAAKRLISLTNPLFLDINAACPAKKVLRKKCGAHLVHKPKPLYKIIKKLSSSLSLPITVKLRIGYSSYDEKEFLSIVKDCERAGASTLFIHGRTMKQGYSGVVNYEAIRQAKASVAIPVFGSGDVLSPELAQKMFDRTHCDGVLVARGAQGNPWFFSGRTPDFVERKEVLLKHLSYVEKYKEVREKAKIGFMKKITIWYLKALPNSVELRNRITACKSYGALVDFIKIA